jgi:sugar phosphate isomerase/epimerase
VKSSHEQTPTTFHNINEMSISRREFLTRSALSGSAAMLVNSIDTFAKPLMTQPAPGFELIVFATNWGFEGSWNDFFYKVKALGYDGAEVWYPGEQKERAAFHDAIQKHGMKFGLLVGGSDKDPEKHLQQFKSGIDAALSAKPEYINCHSGRDYFSFEQNRHFIDFTTEASSRSGIPIYHETHRSRILYAANVAREYMEKIPALRLTLDISHWCNVHESLLADQADTVAFALSRTGHVHARVGHPEGPQVSDPRAPEWKEAVDQHFKWWDMVAERKKKEGGRMTVLTEFGPPDYMPTIPYTRQPVADQWGINKYMLDTLRARYA